MPNHMHHGFIVFRLPIILKQFIIQYQRYYKQYSQLFIPSLKSVKHYTYTALEIILLQTCPFSFYLALSEICRKKA